MYHFITFGMKRYEKKFGYKTKIGKMHYFSGFQIFFMENNLCQNSPSIIILLFLKAKLSIFS